MSTSLAVGRCTLRVAAAVVILWGCGGPDETNRPQSSGQALSKGTLDTADTFVGAVLVPNLAHLVFTGGNGDALCSGSLVSPRVFLTAGHCTALFAAYGISPSQMSVSLAPNVFSDPSPLQVASYNTAPGFQVTGGDKPDINDLGVVVLAHPVNNVPVAKLPPIGYLADFLNSDLTVVGYGVDANFFLSGNRMETTMRAYELADTTVKLSPDPGSFCLMDSGGPSLSQDENRFIVSTHSSGNGNTSSCGSTGYDTRLDVEWAQNYIRAQIAVNPATALQESRSATANGSCDTTINPCCCDSAGHTLLKKSDPGYFSCSLTCGAVKPKYPF